MSVRMTPKLLHTLPQQYTGEAFSFYSLLTASHITNMKSNDGMGSFCVN